MRTPHLHGGEQALTELSLAHGGATFHRWAFAMAPPANARRVGAVKLIVRAEEVRLKQAGLASQHERPPSYFTIKVQEDREVEIALRFLALVDHCAGD